MNFRKMYDGILIGCGASSALSILSIVVLVSFNVLLRKFMQTSVSWTVEVCEYALYFATFMAAPWVLAKNAHIRVDIFTSFLTDPLRRFVDRFVDLIGLGVSLVFLIYGIEATYASWASNALIFKELVLPEWQLLAIMPLSAVLLTIEFLLRLSGLQSTQQEDH